MPLCRLCLTIAWLALWGVRGGAEDVQVTLKDGSTHAVRTSFGFPERFENHAFAVEKVFPTFGQQSDWRQDLHAWGLMLRCKQPTWGSLTVRSPLLGEQSFKTILWPVFFPAAASKVFTVGMFPEPQFPGVWEWAQTPASDSWIPFDFSIDLWGREYTPEIPREAWESARPYLSAFPEKGASFTFRQWVRLTPDDKRSFLNILTERKKEIEGVDWETVRLPDGTEVQRGTRRGVPARHGHPGFQIDDLSPLGQTSGTTRPVPSWVLSGKMRNHTSAIVQVWSTEASPRMLVAARIKGEGRFSIPFAPREPFPEFWTWLSAKQDEWLAFRIRVQIDAAPEPLQMVEWFKTGKPTRNHILKAFP